MQAAERDFKGDGREIVALILCTANRVADLRRLLPP
jgi:hypothetical protein